MVGLDKLFGSAKFILFFQSSLECQTKSPLGVLYSPFWRSFTFWNDQQSGKEPALLCMS